jgi:signal transduction histidine kinase
MRSIVLDGKNVGTIYLISDSRDINDRLIRYAEIVGIVLLMSLLAALGVSSISQRKISRPIVQLADLASSVSRDKNYSVRANPAGSDDEISRLIVSFNEMLAQIQQRDTALQKAHDELEARVGERTAELERAQFDLRALSGRLIQMQDDERRRIARELHDSAGQILVALKLNLAQLEPNAERLDRKTSRLAECLSLIDELTKELRTISHLLHPPLLDELGLISAVRWYVEGFAERSKIPVDLDLSSDFGRLPRELETTIFRIVQECLTNIHRHSGSATANIRITRDSRNIELEVRDHGKGISADATGTSIGPVTPGVGIQGMRERVRQLNGKLEIRSSKNGTSVIARLPISPSFEENRYDDASGRTGESRSNGSSEKAKSLPSLT